MPGRKGFGPEKLIFLNYCSGPVAKHFGDALRHFIGVIAHAEDRICSNLFRVPDHNVKRFLARFLAEFGVNGNISSHEGLKTCANGSKYASRANGNSTDDSEIFYNPETF